MKTIEALRIVYYDLIARGMKFIPYQLRAEAHLMIENDLEPNDNELIQFFYGDCKCAPYHICPFTFEDYPFEVDIKCLNDKDRLDLNRYSTTSLELVYCYTTLTGEKLHFAYFGTYSSWYNSFDTGNNGNWDNFGYVEEKNIHFIVKATSNDLINTNSLIYY